MSWDDAPDLAARVTGRIVSGGEDALVVLAPDHGGADGGYEFTWGTGKLRFEAMKVRNVRVHDQERRTGSAPPRAPAPTWCS